MLVANRPRLMRELVLAAIHGQPDIEVVGEVSNENDLADAIEESQPDVLILKLDTSKPREAQCGFLLGRHPQMRILALAPEEIAECSIGRSSTCAPNLWKVQRREF